MPPMWLHRAIRPKVTQFPQLETDPLGHL
jgi:hypothetical protein